jgi:hypothetical protein
MRTTLNLDPDVYALLKSLAAYDNVTMSVAASRILRESLAGRRRLTAKEGLPVFSGRPKDVVITPELVAEIVEREE